MYKLPNWRRHERSPGDNPVQSDQIEGELARTQSRTIVRVLSIRDEAIKSGSESGRGKSPVASSRWIAATHVSRITQEVGLNPLNPPLQQLMQRKFVPPDPRQGRHFIHGPFRFGTAQGPYSTMLCRIRCVRIRTVPGSIGVAFPTVSSSNRPSSVVTKPFCSSDCSSLIF